MLHCEETRLDLFNNNAAKAILPSSIADFDFLSWLEVLCHFLSPLPAYDAHRRADELLPQEIWPHAIPLLDDLSLCSEPIFSMVVGAIETILLHSTIFIPHVLHTVILGDNSLSIHFCLRRGAAPWVLNFHVFSFLPLRARPLCSTTYSARYLPADETRHH